MQIVLTVLLLAAFFTNIMFLTLAFSRNDKRGGSYFAVLAGVTMFYCLGYAMELWATTPREVMFALWVENLGIPLLAPAFLFMMLGFFQSKYLRPWMMSSCMVYGALMFLMVFVNDYHRLYYTGIEMRYNGAFYAPALGHGPLYLVQQIISMVVLVATYVIFIAQFIMGSSKLRRQMLFFMIGAAFPFVANVLYVLKLTPLGMDLMPISVTIGLIFFRINIGRHKMMDIVPAAFDMAIDNLDVAVLVLDNDWGFIHCNGKARDMFPALNNFSGIESIVGIPGWPAELKPQAGNQITFEMLDIKAQAATLQQADITDILNRRRKKIGVSIHIKDVTEATNMFNKLEKMATTDPLTGVFNRRHFDILVKYQLDMAKRLDMCIGLAILDIDRFKLVNDTYGHTAGDHVLCSMVEAVSRQLRNNDVIARFGGEEFTVLCTEESESGLRTFMERLRRAVEDEIIVFGGQPIRITASFGAVLIPPGRSIEDAMLEVDRALYEAKESGRNRVIIGKLEAAKPKPKDINA